MREDDIGRAAGSWASPEEPAREESPALPRSPAARQTPLTGYKSADELYAAMAATRRENLAKLTGAPAGPDHREAAEPAAVGTRPHGRGLLGWGMVLAAVAFAAGARFGRRSE